MRSAAVCWLLLAFLTLIMSAAFIVIWTIRRERLTFTSFCWKRCMKEHKKRNKGQSVYGRHLPLKVTPGQQREATIGVQALYYDWPMANRSAHNGAKRYELVCVEIENKRRSQNGTTRRIEYGQKDKRLSTISISNGHQYTAILFFIIIDLPFKLCSQNAMCKNGNNFCWLGTGRNICTLYMLTAEAADRSATRWLCSLLCALRFLTLLLLFLSIHPMPPLMPPVFYSVHHRLFFYFVRSFILG